MYWHVHLSYPHDLDAFNELGEPSAVLPYDDAAALACGAGAEGAGAGDVDVANPT